MMHVNYSGSLRANLPLTSRVEKDRACANCGRMNIHLKVSSVPIHECVCRRRAKVSPTGVYRADGVVATLISTYV